jgi:hypothetical protein
VYLQNKHTMQTQAKNQTPRRAMAADTKAATEQVAKTQAAVDAWEAQVAATDLALKMRFADDMREERAAEARKERADNARLEANTRAVALKQLGFGLIKDANAARMATEEGQAAQRLAREKLMDRRMR